MRRTAPRRPRGRAFSLGFALALVLVSGALASAGSAGAETVAPGAPESLASAAASGAPSGGPPGPGSSGPAATLEQCVTSLTQADRSATFVGEMTAIAGTARMSMRIELQERLPAQTGFHTVAAPGLGVWRAAAPGVKVYRYIKQVTNLSAPAVYRAAVRFRWLNAKGKLIRAVERRTSTCTQPPGLKPLPGTTPGFGG
jgi:hypothetical protein